MKAYWEIKVLFSFQCGVCIWEAEHSERLIQTERFSRAVCYKLMPLFWLYELSYFTQSQSLQKWHKKGPKIRVVSGAHKELRNSIFNSLLHSRDDTPIHTAPICPSSQLSKFPVPTLRGIKQSRRKHEGGPLSLLSQTERRITGKNQQTQGQLLSWMACSDMELVLIYLVTKSVTKHLRPRKNIF